MTLRTITIDTATHKVVPIEPTIEITHAALDLNRSQMPSLRAPIGFEYFLFGEAYKAMIAAAPEYQDIGKDE